ncbi:gluconate 2-dehydrogenase subunit 3 family protein [Corallococcus praedator]|uniref:Gluconate 2-dehydrogenase subunit 3 family protein n=1 Tax=Corallococcus praedator TaxID=2316724 RepID=A0ABX9Q6M5_9BACT|nr:MULTISPECIES: gluconate 2-dehydrogenase subunit 3 family protein [Corallococcus]RKH29334.1 gluconate 2-dehydrogenase subunit 3 family protein [Corallococcus sp. CA031C]RKH92713.1 gluconate 2-dehydrogenase subunit 3 family protein [Corallococcus praedator]
MARASSLPRRLSRRTFIQRLTFFGGGVVLLGGAACKRSKDPEPAKPSEPSGTTATGQALRTFSAFEYAVVVAATERLLPRDEDPGAQDADVALYIDRILETQGLESMHRDFLQGLAALERRADRMFQTGFAKATPAQQDELLAIFKDSAAGSGEAHFFELLMTLSLEGFLGDPSYGGNKGRVGWRLMGFDTVGTIAMAPPEGYDGPKCLRECGGHP